MCRICSKINIIRIVYCYDYIVIVKRNQQFVRLIIVEIISGKFLFYVIINIV